jgi:hypothetical protein
MRLIAAFVASAIAAPLALLNAPVAAQDAAEQAALAAALRGQTVTLEKGLAASAKAGKPISGKFEIEDGKLILSVYTVKGGKFYEVVEDPKTGKVEKTEAITDKGDLDHATAQSASMGKVKGSLSSAVSRATKANRGFRAVSAYPGMKDGHPVADITLVQGSTFKSVSQKLD